MVCADLYRKIEILTYPFSFIFERRQIAKQNEYNGFTIRRLLRNYENNSR